MEFSKLIYRVEDGISHVQLNYPKNLNAIDEAMADEILYALDMAERDERVKVLLISGQEKAFSAGGDVGYFYKQIKSGDVINIDGLLEKVARITVRMKTFPKLIISSVSGAVAGAGVSLALSADFVIASQNAKFILAFVNLGLVPDTGSTYLLTKQLGDKRAMEYCITGEPILAIQAQEWGLVNKVVAIEELDKISTNFAKKLSQGPQIAYKHIKAQIYESVYQDYIHYLSEVELPTQQACVTSEDFKEGVQAFIEKRKVSFKGK